MPGMKPEVSPAPEAAVPPALSDKDRAIRRAIYAWDVVGLLFLLASAVAYHRYAEARRLLPSPAGPVPLGAAWWGAVGGITVSLRGLHKHAVEWRPEWNGWHFQRPVVGAIYGAVSALAIAAVVAISSGGSASPRQVVVAFVAFLAGHSDRDFAALLQQARQVVLRGGEGSAPSLTTAPPPDGRQTVGQDDTSRST
jgi:hypothetical protein